MIPRIRRQYENHIAEDLVEQKLLEIKPRMELLDQLTEINKEIKDPTIQLQINKERNDIKNLIEILQKYYGISLFDVFAKIGVNLMRNQILQQREADEKRKEAGIDTDLFDLVDENNLLISQITKPQYDERLKQGDIAQGLKLIGKGKGQTELDFQNKQQQIQSDLERDEENRLARIEVLRRINQLRNAERVVKQLQDRFRDRQEQQQQQQQQQQQEENKQAQLDVIRQRSELRNQERAVKSVQDKFKQLKDKQKQQQEEQKGSPRSQRQKKQPSRQFEQTVEKDQEEDIKRTTISKSQADEEPEKKVQPLLQLNEQLEKEMAKTEKPPEENLVENAVDYVNNSNQSFFQARLKFKINESQQQIDLLNQNILKAGFQPNDQVKDQVGFKYSYSAKDAKQMIQLVRDSNLDQETKYLLQFQLYKDYQVRAKKGITLNENEAVEQIDKFLSTKPGAPKKKVTK